MGIVRKSSQIVAFVFLLVIPGSCKSDLGDLKTGYRDIIVRDGTLSFDKKRWARANEEQRGKMLADLVRTRTFVGKKNEEIFDLLGERTCYYTTEDEPCYWLMLQHRWYLFVFGVNHSGAPGTISHIDLYPRDVTAE